VTTKHQISIRGIAVEVVRKSIKNLHVGVYPPEGRVRVAAPLRLTDEAIRLAVVSRLGWIRRQRAGFLAQDRQSSREFVSGETHYFQGRRYRLSLVHRNAPPTVTLPRNTTIRLTIRPGTDGDGREAVLQRWYRQALREQLPDLIAKWQPVLRAPKAEWGIRRMRTRWGSCNQGSGKIWVNLELAKKSPSCLEYIVVHEMVHLLERHHNERFVALMDKFMPQWRLQRDRLNRAPLAHEEWEY
jgi:hypothetical protein